jgi:hypothetical protein
LQYYTKRRTPKITEQSIVIIAKFRLGNLKFWIMSKEKELKEKSTKKEPKMTLKEKRNAKAAKREMKSHEISK